MLPQHRQDTAGEEGGCGRSQRQGSCHEERYAKSLVRAFFFMTGDNASEIMGHAIPITLDGVSWCTRRNAITAHQNTGGQEPGCGCSQRQSSRYKELYASSLVKAFNLICH